MPSPSPPPPPPPAATTFTSPFNYMSGSFDFPPSTSSTSPTSVRPAAVSDHLQPQILYPIQFQAEFRDLSSPAPDNVHDRLLDFDEDRMTISSRHPRAIRQLRRPLGNEHDHWETPDSLLRRAPPPVSSSSSSLSSNRPRAVPSERYLRRSHARLREQRSTDMDLTTDMFEPLNDDSPRHDSAAAAGPSFRPSRSPLPELDTSRRTKRRKLDHDPLRGPYDGFRYGYKGQVVAGRLKMEIVSCDGGEYGKANQSGLYNIHNVLKNDKSVYCSERSRCNLLLKHIGDMPFTLEKVVIRAPDRGFTAPVQEGLIFVAMSSDDLISGTSRYQIEYEAASSRASPAPSSHQDQQLSFREAIEDPYIWENSRHSLQEAMEEQIERLRLRGRRAPSGTLEANRARRRRERRSLGQEDQEMYPDNCDYPPEDFGPGPGISAPTPPPFTITTESDEEESDSTPEQPSPAIMADRLRRESRWRAESDESEDDLLYRFPPPRRSYALEIQEQMGERRRRPDRALEPLRATRLRTPSRIEPKETHIASEGLISPSARFFIAKHKNKITIKFHPAVSGKFVLLKLWSPTHDGNIDIETVQFYGYSGPRFFPSYQPC